MADCVKDYKYVDYGRIKLEQMIDDGKYMPDSTVSRYFYNSVPYKYTVLEPNKNYMASIGEES